MKRRFILTSILFRLGLCLTAAPAFAQDLLEVVDAAQITIQRKFPNRDSLARRIALEELERNARSEDPADRIIAAILERFPETSAVLFAKSDLNANGIPDEWERKFNVSAGFMAPASDEDADGFTLAQEYKAGTDPVDPLSHPKYITRVYASGVRRLRFDGLELVSVDTTKRDKRDWVAMFNVVRNSKKRGEFVHIGDRFRNDDVDFTVVDIKVDGKTREPVVFIRRADRDERIPCRPRRPVRDSVMQVKSLDSLRGRTFVSTVGDTFRLGSKKTGVETYRIVSADPDTKTIVVESVGENSETFKIPPVPNDLRVAKTASAKNTAQAKNAVTAKTAANAPVKTAAASAPARTAVTANPPARSAALPGKVEARAARPAAARTSVSANAPAGNASRTAAQPAAKKSKAEPLPIFHKKKNAQRWF